jgi:hypothetical protein
MLPWLFVLCCLTTRAETIRSALEILAVCSVMPKAQLQLCENIKLPEREAVPAIRYVCDVTMVIFLNILNVYSRPERFLSPKSNFT